MKRKATALCSKNPPKNTNTGIIVHNYKINSKGIKKKVIYHFSDLHLTQYDSFSSESERKTAIKKTEFWKNGREHFANTYNEPFTAEQCKDGYTHLINLLAEAEKGDAVIMTGDICDYISTANLRAVNKCLNGFTVPFMYVCGNHEDPKQIPDGQIVSQLKKPVQILDLDDVIIFGIDNSLRNITAVQNEQLKKALLSEKPLIIAMHIPIMTEENKAQLEKCEEYYILNSKDATKETLEFIELIKQNSSKIIAVLAGHLHFMNNSEIAPSVTQYVSSQGLLGNINRYEIGF